MKGLWKSFITILFSHVLTAVKLRAFSNHAGQFIFYKSPASPDTLRQCLTHAYGESGRVKKHRTLFMVGRTRVHLDKVEGLGDFLELDVVLAEDEANEAGVSIANSLMEKLGVFDHQLIEEANVNLLASSIS